MSASVYPFERLERIASVMRMIQEDCEQEAMALEGAPFTGRFVAEQFGNLLAEVSAVAKAVEVIAAALVKERGDAE